MDASTLLLLTPLRSTMALFASTAPCAPPESDFPVNVEESHHPDFPILQTTASNTQHLTRKSNWHWSSLAWRILQASHPYSPLFKNPLWHSLSPHCPSSKYLESPYIPCSLWISPNILLLSQGFLHFNLAIACQASHIKLTKSLYTASDTFVLPSQVLLACSLFIPLSGYPRIPSTHCKDFIS